MASARYWRLTGVAPRDIGANLSLSDIALYDGAARVDGAAAISCTATPIAGTLAALADGSTATSATFAAADATAPGFALVWDFGGTQEVTEMRFTAAGAPAEFIYQFGLSTSADGAVWDVPTEYAGIPLTDAGATVAVALGGDPHAYKVQLLLHGESLADASVYARTLTANGGASVSTAQSKFGGSSLYFDGSGDYLTGDASIMAFGTQDFTVEAFVYLAALPTSDNWPADWNKHMEVCGIGTPSVGDGCAMLLGATKLILQSNDGIVASGAHGIALNTWRHVAVSRQGSNFYCFSDGIMVGSAVSAAAMGGGSGFYVGCETGQGAWFNGHIDELRITKGSARYTANFTPPTTQFDNIAAYAIDTAPRPAVAAAAPSLQLFAPPPMAALLPPAPPALDITDGGVYQITGTVKEKATPANTPLARKVQLYHQTSGRLVRETWSAASDGGYSFTNLRGDQVYFVVAFDHTGTYRAVIADSQTAQAMPL